MDAVITINLNPFLHLGPLTLAWHGLTIAIGVLIGALAASRWLTERDLSTEPLYTICLLIAVGGIVGGRVFYVLEHPPAGGWQPSSLVGTTGFTFDGGVILAAALVVAYVARAGLSLLYLDAVATGLPLGVALGRIGDVINGEHYGPPSNFFLAVRNANPDALTPDARLAYQSGGLYEVLLAAAIFAVIWPLRHRFTTPTVLMWSVIASFSAGRFFEFFLRSDSPDLALGLNNAQWTSLALLIASLLGLAWVLSRRRDEDT